MPHIPCRDIRPDDRLAARLGKRRFDRLFDRNRKAT